MQESKGFLYPIEVYSVARQPFTAHPFSWAVFLFSLHPPVPETAERRVHMRKAAEIGGMTA